MKRFVKFIIRKLKGFFSKRERILVAFVVLAISLALLLGLLELRYFLHSGIFGKLAIICLVAAEIMWVKDNVFKKIKLEEGKYQMGVVINVWTGEPEKVVPPEKLFWVIPGLHKIILVDLTLQQSREMIHGNPEGVDVQTEINVPFQPDPKRVMKYFQAGDVNSLIFAAAQKEIGDILSQMSLKEALEERDAIIPVVEARLTKGPLSVIFEKIFFFWKLIGKGEAKWEREIRREKEELVETPEGRDIRTTAKERIVFFWAQVESLVQEIARFLIDKDQTEIELASEEIKKEVEMWLNRVFRMGKDIERIEERFKNFLKDKSPGREIKEILKDIAFIEGGKIIELKGNLRKEIEDEMEKSKLEDLLGIKISPPQFSSIEPEAEEVRKSIRALIDAGFRKEVLDTYARQKNVTIQKFFEAYKDLPPEQRLAPKEILDALLIDAGRVEKKQYEIPGLKEALVEIAKILLKKGGEK